MSLGYEEKREVKYRAYESVTAKVVKETLHTEKRSWR